MNRRLMMAQRSKAFELVYNSSSGTLPTTQGWNFGCRMYGYEPLGGTQSMSDNLLNVNVKHAYEACRYYIADKPTAKNCEISVTVESSDVDWNNSRMGILLTNGEKAIEVNYKAQSGWLYLNNNADSFNSGKFIKQLNSKSKFTLKARLENGCVSVFRDDELVCTVTQLYDVSEILTSNKAVENGTPHYGSQVYLYPTVTNMIAFAIYGTYKVSQLTYKEW